MRKLLLAIATLAVVGCGGDSTGPIASAVGTWRLQTVNGAALPYTVIFTSSPVYRLEIISDTFVANSNGTYGETLVARETNGSTVTTQTTTDNGTWVQNNGAVTVTASDGTVTNAALTGDILTLSDGTTVLVYARQ